MKYGEVFKKQVVPEWHEMYLNYKLLKKLLKPLRVLSKVYLRINYNDPYQKHSEKYTITNVTLSDLTKIQAFLSRFEKLVFYEFEKINLFFEFKLMEQLKRWRLFKINMTILQNLRGNNPNYDSYKEQLKNAYHQFYKEIILMNQYLIVNQEGLRKILKKYKKIISDNADMNKTPLHISEPHSPKFKNTNHNNNNDNPNNDGNTNVLLFSTHDLSNENNIIYKLNNTPEMDVKATLIAPSIKNRFDIAFSHSYIQKFTHKLHSLRSDLEHQYLDFFYKKFNRKQGQDELRRISQGRLISQSESFYFGLFLGIALILIFLICLLAWYGDLDVDDDALFKDVFPMFRGIGAFILYIWLLAWNVYGFTTANINYKLILGFNHHFSQISEILKRAAFFTMLFLLMFLWYIILRQNLGKLADFLAFLPKEFTPLVVWFAFLGYLFFPSNKILNPMGRMYSYKLLRDIVFKPTQPLSFKIAWSTDQLASFVGPLKDLEYTICFYSGNFFNAEHVNYCQSKHRFSSGFIVAFIPLFLRIIQCINNMYYKKSYFGVDFFNSIKYVIALIVVVFSFLTTLDSQGPYLNFWIIFALISTFYSSFWDLKMDWGFLTPGIKNHLLRKSLSYNHKSYYYIAMSVNLILRFGWTLSISTDIVARIMRPEIFAFIISFMEMLRRCIWNFFRVEKEHIQNCGVFKAVEDIVLPFENICFDMEMGDMKLFKTNNGLKEQNVKKLSKLLSTNSQLNLKKMESNPIEIPLLSNKKASFVNLTDNGKKYSFVEELDKDLGKESGDCEELKDNREFRKSMIKVSLFSKKSIMDLTKEELKYRATSEETYESVKAEVEIFCSEIKKNIEFRFKVFENR